MPSLSLKFARWLQKGSIIRHKQTKLFVDQSLSEQSFRRPNDTQSRPSNANLAELFSRAGAANVGQATVDAVRELARSGLAVFSVNRCRRDTRYPVPISVTGTTGGPVPRPQNPIRGALSAERRGQGGRCSKKCGRCSECFSRRPQHFRRAAACLQFYIELGCAEQFHDAVTSDPELAEIRPGRAYRAYAPAPGRKQRI
jgi:hypothetical protein